jgi:hypothetical protein
MYPVQRLLHVLARCVLFLGLALVCSAAAAGMLTNAAPEPDSVASVIADGEMDVSDVSDVGFDTDGNGGSAPDSDMQGDSNDEGEENAEARFIEHRLWFFGCSGYELSHPQINEPSSCWLTIDPGPARA